MSFVLLPLLSRHAFPLGLMLLNLFVRRVVVGHAASVAYSKDCLDEGRHPVGCFSRGKLAIGAPAVWSNLQGGAWLLCSWEGYLRQFAEGEFAAYPASIACRPESRLGWKVYLHGLTFGIIG